MHEQDERSDEVLVVMRSATADALDPIRRSFAVRHVFSPRIAVVAADAPDEAGLRAVDGVALVTRGPIPEEALGDLDDRERLLVRGWAMRESLQTKARPGDRQDWDSEGRLPPDLP